MPTDTTTAPDEHTAAAWLLAGLLESRAMDPKEPYGPADEAHYADPGYQSDGKKRYPLSDEGKCRAAWSYINMPKHAAMYSAEHLAKIKARIKAAGEKFGIDFAERDDRGDDTTGEYRRYDVPDYATRAYDFDATTGDGRTLEGYAAVFGQSARISATHGDFDETIRPGAFARSLRNKVPVLQWEHGRDPRVGMVPIGAIDEIREDNKGLFVRARLFDNPVVEPIRQAIAGKAVKGMSFRFNVAKGGDVWQSGRSRYGVDKRDVIDANLPEVSPVVFPAYDNTTVSVRSILSSFGAEERAALVRELAAEVRAAVDLSDFTGRPAPGAGGGEPDATTQERRASPATPATPAPPRPHLRQRLDEGALRVRGIIT